MIPHAPLRRILRAKCPHQISRAAVTVLQTSLEDMADEIAKLASIEFNQLNEQRGTLGIYPLKRLNKWSVQKACHKFLKPVRDRGGGLLCHFERPLQT